MLTRMLTPETTQIIIVSNNSTSWTGLTVISNRLKISRTGNTACASRPSLIVFCNPGVTNGLTVRTRIAVTSRCSSGNGLSLSWPSAPASWMVAAALLGYVGFAWYFSGLGEPRSPWDILYLTLQLFTLESGAVPGTKNWALELLTWPVSSPR